MTLLAFATRIMSVPLAQVAGDGPVEMLDLRYEFRPLLPAPLLLAALAVVVLLAAWIYSRPRIELSRRWRLVLGTLRAAALAVPFILLFQPERVAELRRSQPHNVTLLVDASGSMGLADGPESPPSTRWQRMIQALGGVAATFDAIEPAARPRLKFLPFDTQLGEPGASPPNAEETPAIARHTALGTALQAAADGLAGERGSHLVLLTDGADNASPAEDHPREVARRLARTGLAVNTCLVGREHPRNLAVTLTSDAPFAFAGDPVTLRARLQQEEFADQVVTLTLLEEDRRLASREVSIQAGVDSISERFEVVPDRAGRQRYRISVEPAPGELMTTDNQAVAEVRVINEPIRALYMEHWPRWQYRFLRNALVRDPRFETTLVLVTEDPATPASERQTARFPESAESLSSYDVVVIGDVSPQDLTPEQWDMLVEHVTENGAGIVCIAGPAHMPAEFVDSALAPLLPVGRTTSVSTEDVQPFQPRVTTLGGLHPLMRLSFGADAQSIWQELPPLQWYAGLADVKPGAMILADRTNPTGQEAVPLILIQRVGRGTAILVGTDETWRWRYEHGNRYFYGFWSHVMQHAGLPHRVGEFNTVRIDAPTSASVGLPVTVTAAVDARAGLAEGTVSDTARMWAEPLDGLGAPVSVAMSASPDAANIFAGQLRLPHAGRYRLYLEQFPDQGDAVIDVSTDPTDDPERADARVDEPLLRQVAALTGGEFVRLDELGRLIGRLDLAPLRYDWTERTPLWDGWMTLVVLAALLTTEWILRKWRYLP